MKTQPENLPTELQSIVEPASPTECAAIARTIKEPQSKVDRYQLYLAQEYFRNNISSFSKDELLAVFNNRYFHKQLTGKYAESLIDACIQHKVSYPINLNIWNSDNYNEKLKKYISILDEENNEQQLQFLYQRAELAITHYFNSTPNISDSLAKIILENDPHKILDIPGWDDNKKYNWINNNRVHIKDIVFKNYIKFLNDKNLSKTLKNNIYNILNEEIENTKEKSEKQFISKHYCAISLPIDYLTYSKKFPSQFNSFLNETIHTTRDDGLILNGAQNLLLNRTFKTLTEIKNIFNDQKELLTKDLSEKINFYLKKINPFEYALRNNRHIFFTAFTLDDALLDEHKEMLVAAAFSSLKKVHDNANTEEGKYLILSSWYPDIILNATNEQFNYYKKEITATGKNKDLEAELKKFKMIRDLNNSLNVNPTQKVKTKI